MYSHSFCFCFIRYDFVLDSLAGFSVSCGPFYFLSIGATGVQAFIAFVIEKHLAAHRDRLHFRELHPSKLRLKYKIKKTQAFSFVIHNYKFQYV
jgi:hypothetical protein